jgi:hypothetical protein
MINRRQLLAATPLALVACTTPIIEDGTELRPNEGILALRVSANATGWLGITPYGESSYGARVSENLLGAKRSLYFRENESRLIVLSIESGEYMWSKLATTSHYAWLLSSTRLRILAGQVTYIGDLRISFVEPKFSIRVMDREHDMRQSLASSYPLYSDHLPFRKNLAELNVR